jgi:hypothetical protein
MLSIGLFKNLPLVVCCLETKKHTHMVIVFKKIYFQHKHVEKNIQNMIIIGKS